MEILFIVWLSFTTPNIVARLEEFKAACVHLGGSAAVYPGPNRMIWLPSDGRMVSFTLSGMEVNCVVNKGIRSETDPGN